MADFRHDYTRTFLQTTDALDLEELNEAFEVLEGQATAQLLSERVSAKDILLLRSVEMRYRGQGHNLEVPVPSADLDEESIQAINGAFHRQHQTTYGYGQPKEITEFVNLRLAGIGRLPKPHQRRIASNGQDPGLALVGRRQVYFAGHWHDTPIYGRDLLRAGHRLEGPAIVEQLDSTTVILPGQQAEIDAQGNILVAVQ
jgi:N-methylhydantoinase A